MSSAVEYPEFKNGQDKKMNQATNATVSDESSRRNGIARDLKPASSSSPSHKSPLTEEMLARFASRAALYDEQNRFFAEDFEELRASQYLLLPLPPEFGGAGMSLAEVCREQRR